jgi:hypothetical protein
MTSTASGSRNCARPNATTRSIARKYRERSDPVHIGYIHRRRIAPRPARAGQGRPLCRKRQSEAAPIAEDLTRPTREDVFVDQGIASIKKIQKDYNK